jgi:hypothetical protein
VHDPGRGGIDVGREVAHKVVLGQSAESTLVDDDVRERPRGWRFRAHGGDRFALVEPKRSDVDEPDDIRRVVAEGGHDLPAVGMPHDDAGPVLPGEGLAQAGDIVGEGGQRELRGGDVIALGLQVLHDGAPARSVGEGAVDQNDIRLLGHRSLLGWAAC